MIRNQQVLLYHAPPSFYSQIARLVLEEKGVQYRTYIVMAGPPLYESYEPWYMKLNSGGTVPTLLIGDKVIDDSRTILYEVDAQFDGQALTPISPSAIDEMERWIEKAYSLPERILTYGTGKFRAIGARVNVKRKRALLKRRERYPELRAVYDSKLADINSFLTDSRSEAKVEALGKQYESALDELDAWLSTRPYICGASYSLADIVWTILVARQQMLKLSPLKNRPSLVEWYVRVKARDSFKRADVWDKFEPRKLLPIVLAKLKWHLLSVAFLLVALCALLIFLFR